MAKRRMSIHGIIGILRAILAITWSNANILAYVFWHTYFGHNSAIFRPIGLKIFMGTQETIIYPFLSSLLGKNKIKFGIVINSVRSDIYQELFTKSKRCSLSELSYFQNRKIIIQLSFARKPNSRCAINNKSGIAV